MIQCFFPSTSCVISLRAISQRLKLLSHVRQIYKKLSPFKTWNMWHYSLSCYSGVLLSGISYINVPRAFTQTWQQIFTKSSRLARYFSSGVYEQERKTQWRVNTLWWQARGFVFVFLQELIDFKTCFDCSGSFTSPARRLCTSTEQQGMKLGLMFNS